MGAGHRHTHLLLSVLLTIILNALPVVTLGPSFDVPIVNVTVVAGQTAVLPCSINRIGDYQVAWTDQQGLTLTFQQQRVVDDPRISMNRPYTKEWNLQIFEVRYSDQGVYRCTINTIPPKSKIVQLFVKVPPRIIDELSSDDVVVQEGETVVLVCNVTGVPRPEVKWFRSKASSRNVDKERIGHIGEMIIIQNVSRYCDDEYECVADNKVKPAVKRIIRVTIEFKPEVRLRNNRISQIRGRDTILECFITAYPQASIYWEKDGKRITNNDRNRIETYDEGDHLITLRLQIHKIQRADFGAYKCIAINKLGEDHEVMNLVEYIDLPITFPTTTKSTTIKTTTEMKGYVPDKETTANIDVGISTFPPPASKRPRVKEPLPKNPEKENSATKEKNHNGRETQVGKVTGSNSCARFQVSFGGLCMAILISTITQSIMGV